jgi:hypothetical protein
VRGYSDPEDTWGDGFLNPTSDLGTEPGSLALLRFALLSFTHLHRQKDCLA